MPAAREPLKPPWAVLSAASKFKSKAAAAKQKDPRRTHRISDAATRGQGGLTLKREVNLDRGRTAYFTEDLLADDEAKLSWVLPLEEVLHAVCVKRARLSAIGALLRFSIFMVMYFFVVTQQRAISDAFQSV